LEHSFSMMAADPHTRKPARERKRRSNGTAAGTLQGPELWDALDAHGEPDHWLAKWESEGDLRPGRSGR
jgi:hypothetical protein